MFLSENIFAENTKLVNYDWGQHDCFKLKGEYSNIHTSEVVTYKLPPMELEHYLDNLKNKKQTNLNKKFIIK